MRSCWSTYGTSCICMAFCLARTAVTASAQEWGAGAPTSAGSSVDHDNSGLLATTVHDDLIAGDFLLHVERESRCVTNRDQAAGHQSKVTRWLPLDEASRGRGAPESIARMVHELAQVVTEGYPPLRQCTGVEWWSQEVAPNAGLHVHVDEDVSKGQDDVARRRSASGTMTLPLLSTVVYFDDVQAPTVVFNQTVQWHENAGSFGGLWVKTPAVPRDVALVFPRRGRVTMFDGALVHTVLPEWKALGGRSGGKACGKHNSCGGCTAAGCGWCRASMRCVPDEPQICSDSFDHVGTNGQTMNCSKAAPETRLSFVVNFWRAQPTKTDTMAPREARGCNAAGKPAAEPSQCVKRFEPADPHPYDPQTSDARVLDFEDLGGWFSESREMLRIRAPGAVKHGYFRFDPVPQGGLYVLGDSAFFKAWSNGAALVDWHAPQLLIFPDASWTVEDPPDYARAVAQRYSHYTRTFIVNSDTILNAVLKMLKYPTDKRPPTAATLLPAKAAGRMPHARFSRKPHSEAMLTAMVEKALERVAKRTARRARAPTPPPKAPVVDLQDI